MLTVEQTNLVARSADRAYKRHVSDLVAAVEWVKKLDPGKPNAVGDLWEGFLKDTHAAINKYEEELVPNVIRVTTHVSPALSRFEMEQVRSCCAKFIEPGLYEKRMRLFREALDRNANRFGIKIDYEVARFDLYQARYSVGTVNQVRDISLRLKHGLNILVLSGEAAAAKVTPDAASSNVGDAINVRPSIWGVSIDLKKVWRWWQNKKK